MKKLSRNFSWGEVQRSQTATRNGWNNKPPAELYKNVRRAAAGMEKVRTVLYDKIVDVSSWFRCLKLNRALKSSDTSAHRKGFAVDFTCDGYGKPSEVFKELRSYQEHLQYDQCILEWDAWVHISFDPRARGQDLIIDKKGARFV